MRQLILTRKRPALNDLLLLLHMVQYAKHTQENPSFLFRTLLLLCCHICFAFVSLPLPLYGCFGRETIMRKLQARKLVLIG